MIKTLSVLVIVIVTIPYDLIAQTLDLNYPSHKDYLRRNQLIDGENEEMSFSLSTYNLTLLEDSSIVHFNIKKIYQTQNTLLGISPLEFNMDYNSHHPYGWNNGPMLSSKGVQNTLSVGSFFQFGFLTFSLKPKIIFVENRNFEGFPDSHPDEIWKERYRTWNSSDISETYGANPLLDILPGNSRISLNYKAFSVGASTENLWWGPGRYNSLIMSNNARGFSHLTLNTQKPAITPIGSFEGQLIVGRLQSKEYNELPLPERHNKNPWVFTKKDEWRYLNGITFSYQPKWIPGLFLGGSRVIQNYFDSTKIQKSYLPIFDNFFREKDQNQHDDGSKDQIASIFARWVIFPATSEIYFEYGKSDASWNLRDFLMSPEHSRAYMVGFTKLINFKSTNQQIEISLETTHLEKSKTGTLRAEPSWYRNAELRQGYTHKGEILGAGIGPGSNSQNLSVSWINCFKKVGVLYERVVNNNDFYSRAFDLTDPTGSWVNSSFGILFSWNWDHLLLDSKLQFVHSDNYQWVRDSDRNNLYLSIRSIYLF